MTHSLTKLILSERRSIFLFFSVLMLYPLFNGYPFLYSDSWGYFYIFGPGNLRSPTLACIMRPALTVAGLWGFVIVQTMVAAMSIAVLCRALKIEVGPRLILIAIVLSALGMYTGYVMADIWTLISLILTLTLLAGLTSVGILLLLSFAISTHFGNIPIVLATGLLSAPFFPKTRRLYLLFLCVATAIFMIFATNLLNGEVRLSSTASYSWIGSRIIYQIPESIDILCNTDNSFELCKYRKKILELRKTTRLGEFMWKLRGLMDPAELEAASKGLIWPSLVKYPLEHLRLAISNTLRQCFTVKSVGVLAPARDIERRFRWSIPEKLEEFKLSRQGRDLKAHTSLNFPLLIAYLLSLAVCLAYAAWMFKRYHISHITTLASASWFAIIACFVNAGVMANLSAIHVRYQTRITFLPIFIACVIVGHYIIKRYKRKLYD